MPRPCRRDEADAPRYHPAWRRPLGRRPLMTARCSPGSAAPSGCSPGTPRSPAITGGSRLRLLRMRSVRTRLGQGLGEDVRRGARRRLPPSRLARTAPIPGDAFPSTPVSGMLHGVARTVRVRVVPRSRRPVVEEAPDGSITIRVRAAPEAGRATEEAASALAAHLGVPRTSVRLRAGATSRLKTFEVAGKAF